MAQMPSRTRPPQHMTRFVISKVIRKNQHKTSLQECLRPALSSRVKSLQAKRCDRSRPPSPVFRWRYRCTREKSSMEGKGNTVNQTTYSHRLPLAVPLEKRATGTSASRNSSTTAGGFTRLQKAVLRATAGEDACSRWVI